LIGERINNYQVQSILGEGGMGAVYLAEHPFMGRKAAIKVLRGELAQDKGLVERFMNEARAANAIHHPNIIDIIDVGLLPSGIPYLMMEFLEGESLAKRIEREQRLPVDVAVDVATQTASALYAAHGKGIVHRDLKPDNLFLVPDDARPFGARLTVLDFGIAKLRGELSGSGAKTQSGSVMGTPPYMSPEQCRGITEEIDHRTDIYALGIILYEMLTGAPPFMSAGWGDVVLMHVTKPVPPPRAKNPGIPLELEAVILKALAKAPEDRWPSMAEMDTALRKSIGAPPRGFVSGFNSDGTAKSTTGSGSGRPNTTLGSSSGEVALDEDGASGAAPAWWRRPPALIGGGVALAIAIAAIGIPGRRASAPAQATETRAATLAAPPPVVPAPAAVAPPPAEPAPPAASPLPTPAKEIVAAATPPADEMSGHAKAHTRKHEAHAAKKTASAAAPAPAIAAPASAVATPPATRPKPAAEKW
jgi:serine/threonine-protein kinase